METILPVFFTFQSAIQLYHWNTFSHSRHEAAGELYTAMNELIDRFVEVFIGRFHRPVFRKDLAITVPRLTHKSVVPFLRSFLLFLRDLGALPSELLNIRDEMKAEIDRTLYRFTQK